MALNLPEGGATPFLRLDHSDEKVWREIVDAVGRESEDGFLADIDIIDDAALDGADVDVLAEEVAGQSDHALLLVADSTTMRHRERPILCIDLVSNEVPVRVIPSELWSIENNVSLANMDFAEFVEGADEDGIFRGFPAEAD